MANLWRRKYKIAFVISSFGWILLYCTAASFAIMKYPRHGWETVLLCGSAYMVTSVFVNRYIAKLNRDSKEETEMK
ncbi:MAG: hypothetical protein RLN86_01760 [Cyclobacteriaceae bacterium]